jgi:hypothetical protein
MRKGSKKPVVTEKLPEINMLECPEPIFKHPDPAINPIMDNNPKKVYIPSSYILDILLRICDACHDMDGHYEPWAGIRKDIEGLK